jgi:hypothetical protein
MEDRFRGHKMTETNKITGTDEDWESRRLGADENHVCRVDDELRDKVNNATGMRPISIRLDNALIEAFKIIADFHGVGYQPLMRDALKRFSDSEFKAIVSGVIQSQKAEKKAKAKTEAQVKTKETPDRITKHQKAA